MREFKKIGIIRLVLYMTMVKLFMERRIQLVNGAHRL